MTDAVDSEPPTEAPPTEAPADPPEQPEKPKENLRKLALRGSFWQLLGYVLTYGLRFVSSTVIRSLLFPAAFGIMEVVTGLTLGLIMLSDVGIQQAIVRSERGDEPVFLNTAWTMHVVRGVGLWLIAVVIAYPASLITHTPQVAYLLPIASLSVVTMGFHSTAEFTLRRRVQLGRLVAMETSCMVVSLAVTITWASIQPSVWALVAGGLTNAAMYLGWSYVLAKHVGYFNKFAWDPSVRKEIWDFGKWITGSSAVFFASTWGDRLLIVGFLGTQIAGVYATAVLISEAVGSALDRVVHGVFYPLFARIQRDGHDKLRKVYYGTRLRFDVLTMASTGGLSVMGPWVIELLFDDRYEAAGWMLRVLCLRSATLAIVSPAETCLTALGHSKFGFYQNLLRAIWILAGVPIGYWIGGAEGVVWATALSGIPPILALWPKLWELKLLRLDREALAWVFFGVGAGLGWLAVWLLPEATEIRHWLRDLVS
ncbi:MAG: oligosaccharide flippase family protein [Sandaracinaceae bacterium]|nr:oligosaccharide flippase family protein [Sandaracinaceae bacterium]